MKREMDLVRRLLLAIEKLPDDGSTSMEDLAEFADDDYRHIRYNLALMVDNDLINQPHGSFNFTSLVTGDCITWTGHDFLDAARDDGVWAAAKKRISGLGGVAFSVLLQILIDEVKSRVGLSE